MKLAIETYTLRERFGDIKAIEMIAQAGFDAIDYSFYWGEKEHYMLSDSYKEIAAEIKEALIKNNLTCAQSHAPFKWGPEDRYDFSSENFKELVRSIEFSAIIGAKHIIIHSIPVYDESKTLEETNYEFYKSLEPFCKEFNIKIAVENLYNYNHETKTYSRRFGTAKELTDFINKLNSPYFVACLDVGHSHLTGTPPQDFIRQMDKDTLKALHIHDVDDNYDLHILPYQAELNWEEIAKALAEIGYDGDFTLEVFRYFRNFDNAFMPSALKFAEQTARHIMSKIK